MTPEIVVIAAIADAPGTPSDRLIGDGLELPWHLPADLRRFKALTLGHPLVMGRRTYESLVHQFGGPLPGRETVVLTRSPGTLAVPDGVRIVTSLGAALETLADRETVFIGGGAGVYGSVLGAGGAPVLADRLELTFVEGTFSGDTFFPPYRHLLGDAGGLFQRVASEPQPAAGGQPAFRFDTFWRSPAPTPA